MRERLFKHHRIHRPLQNFFSLLFAAALFAVEHWRGLGADAVAFNRTEIELNGIVSEDGLFCAELYFTCLLFGFNKEKN